MARASERNRVKTWTSRIDAANKTHETWLKRFNIPRLEDYYEGYQWSGRTEEEAKALYVINMVYSTVEVNKPSLIFHSPQVKMSPRPARGGTLGSDSEARARLCEDTVQTLIDDPDFGFTLETSLALHEAHFRFGVIEVGYSSSSVENPRARRPVLKEDKTVSVESNSEDVQSASAGTEDTAEDSSMTDDSGEPVLEPDYRIEDENIFIRRIPAKNFRVSSSSFNKLERNDWVAYCEWLYPEDLKRSPFYKNTDTLRASGVAKEAIVEREDLTKEDIEKHAGMIRVWKIWDMRSKKRYIVADGHDKFLLDGEPFNFLPFAVFKFHEKLDSFYPMPPVYTWIGPQDELNETREAQRAHRRRFYRRYTVQKGMVESGEMDKFETGGDGVIIEVNGPEPIKPVADAPMGADVWQHLGETKQDLLAVTGVSMDQRSVADSETATQATIIDARAKIRESSARTRVGEWLGHICRLILFTIRENMALPFWVAHNVDPKSPFAADSVVGVARMWQEITSEDVGNLDLDISVDLASMSPVGEEAARNTWNQVLALLTNPALIQVMAISPAILRRTLMVNGIRSENEIREIDDAIKGIIANSMQAAQAQAMNDAAAGADKAGVNPELIKELSAGPGGPRNLPDPVSKMINTGGGVN